MVNKQTGGMEPPDLVLGEEGELVEPAGAGAALSARHVGHQVAGLGGRGRQGVALHLVQWCMVQWCSGAVVSWCSGAVVSWCSGAVVQ